MSKITSAKDYALFTKECQFFFCQDIYENDWIGKEKFIIASDTPETVLLEKYPEVMSALSPYMYCNAACGAVFAESKKNISKFNKRKCNTISIEELDKELASENADLETRLIIRAGLEICTPLQRKRISQYYLEGMSLNQIANGLSPVSVYQSIEAGLKRIRKYFGLTP